MALVIIDMQDDFDSEAADVEEAVLEEIRRTRHNELIFVLYLEQRDTVFPSIRYALKKRDNVHYVKKRYNDGSLELWEALSLSPAQKIQRVRFCGVWTSHCVSSTFMSMCEFSARAPLHSAIQSDTKMQLVANACNDPCRASHRGFLRKVKRNQQPNVSVI